MFSENLVYSALQPNLHMKRFLPLFFSLALIITACKNNSTSGESGGSVDPKISGVPDTIKMDGTANRDMLIILGMLPDTLTKSFVWTRDQRLNMRQSVESKGYFLDSLQNFSDVKAFKNNHIDLTVADSRFLMTTYQIRDGHYVVLAIETIKDKQRVNAYEIYKNSAATLDLEELLGKYPLLFMTDATSQSCLGMLYDKNPVFSFAISDNDLVKISIKNYDESGAKGCLKGNQLVLRFNKIEMPFDVVSLTWED